MSYVIVFIIGFLFGWFALRGVVIYRMRNLKKILEDSVARPEIMVNFSRSGDQIYAHNAETDEFLAQGTTKTEIVEQLQKRWPNVSFRATPANLKEVNLE